MPNDTEISENYKKVEKYTPVGVPLVFNNYDLDSDRMDTIPAVPIYQKESLLSEHIYRGKFIVCDAEE